MKKIKISKEEYEIALHNGVYEIVFRKSDDTYRKMIGTLIQAFIPRKFQTYLDGYKNIDKKSLSVYDVEKKSWRSINTDNIAIFKKIDLPMLERKLRGK